MTLLTLVRHGETDWNRDLRIQGSTDIPLNDTGRQQAADAAAALRASLIDHLPVVVVSSDLARARETAQIIATNLDAPEPPVYAALRERAYGEAEGLDVAEFHRRWGDWHTAEIPGAEDREHLRARALKGLRDVVADARRATGANGANLIVVAHGALIREVLFHASAGEYPAPGVRLPNGSAHPILFERDRLRLATPVS